MNISSISEYFGGKCFNGDFLLSDLWKLFYWVDEPGEQRGQSSQRGRKEEREPTRQTWQQQIMKVFTVSVAENHTGHLSLISVMRCVEKNLSCGENSDFHA